MVGRILSIFERQVTGLHEAAYLLGFFALLSQVLALVRDRLFAHAFGAGSTLDIYYAAFRIPDLVFVVIGSLVSIYVLIPLLAERMNGSADAARSFINGIFTWFLIVIVLASACVWWVMPQLVAHFFPGFSGTAAEGDLVILARILLLQPILLGLSNLFASVIQLHRRFLLYALSPILYNLGIIIGIVALYPTFGIVGLAYGVVLGACMHVAIQLPVLIRSGFAPAFSFSLPGKDLLRVVTLSLPRSLALSATNITLLVFAGIASTLHTGSIAVFSLAFNLQSVPLAIVGMSYATAAFPLLASLYAAGERHAFVQKVFAALRHILFWSLPAIALFIVLRAQIVRTILGSGAFDWDATRLTAAALAIFALSLAAQGILLLISRAYYAAGNTRVPLYANGASAVLSVAFVFIIGNIFTQGSIARLFIEDLLRVEGIAGTEMLALPLAFSLGSIIAALWLLAKFMYDFRDAPSGLLRVFVQSGAASVFAGFATYLSLNALDDVFDITTFAGILLQGFSAGAIGILTVAGVLSLLQSAELTEAIESLKSRFWRARTIASGQDEF